MTNQEIITRGELIRDETVTGANTAQRVGEAFVAIGENLEEMGTNLHNISNNLNRIVSYKLSLDKIGYYDNNGNLNTQNSHTKNTGKVRIEGYDKLKYNVNISGCAVAFFDSNDNFMSDISVLGTGSGIIDLTDNAYANAKTVALSYYNGNDDFSGFIGVLNNGNSIEDSISNLQSDVEDIGEQLQITPLFPKDLPLDELGYWMVNGQYSSSTSGKVKNTGKVKINRYDRLDYGASIGTGGCVVAFFDSEGNIIPSLTIEGTGNYVTGTINLSSEVYSDAKYIAISYLDYSENFSNYVGKLYSSENTIDNRIVNLESAVSNLQSEVEDIGEQLQGVTPPPKDLPLTMNGYWSVRWGYRSDSKARCTDFINIKGYTRLDYGASISADAYMVVFKDDGGNIITEASVTGNGSFTTGTIDLTDALYQNAKSVAICYYNYSENFGNYIGLLYNPESIEIKVRDLGSRVSLLENLSTIKEDGLNILIFGDSITDCATVTIDENNRTSYYKLKSLNNSYRDANGSLINFSMWPYLITTIFPCNDVRNYAKSGASYKWTARDSGLERQNVIYQIEVALNDISNPNGAFPTTGDYLPDIVIFALGTNDGTPNDTYSSAMNKTVMVSGGTSFDVDATLNNLDKTKFCEAVRYSFLKVKRQFPFALFICVLPIQRMEYERSPLNEQLRLMAERYGMIIVDGCAQAGIIRDLEAPKDSNLYSHGVYLTDGLHPNDQGQKLMTKMIANAIKNNYINLE